MWSLESNHPVSFPREGHNSVFVEISYSGSVSKTELLTLSWLTSVVSWKLCCWGPFCSVPWRLFFTTDLATWLPLHSPSIPPVPLCPPSIPPVPLCPPSIPPDLLCQVHSALWSKPHFPCSSHFQLLYPQRHQASWIDLSTNYKEGFWLEQTQR